MTLEITKYIKQGGLLVVTLIVVNFLNFVLSAFLGRSLSLEEFGLVTLFNTLAYFLAMITNALSGVVNYRTSHLHGESNYRQAKLEFGNLVRWVMLPSIGITIVWLALSGWLSQFFNISGREYLILFSPIFTVTFLLAVYRGYLQGIFRFIDLALLLLSETASKLILAFVLVKLELDQWVFLVIPISVVIALCVATFLFWKSVKSPTLSESNEPYQEVVGFSWKYFSAVLLAGLSSAVFLNVDMVLAKHYLSATAAGEYALLSLIGKVVFFASTLLNIFIVTFVRDDEAKNINPSKKFYELLGGTTILAAGSFILLGVFGQYTAPLLFGEKTHLIIPYVRMYTLAAAFISVAGFITSYHSARQQYFFSKVAVLFASAMVVGIWWLHTDIFAIVHIVFYTSTAFLVTVVILHALSWLKQPNIIVSVNPSVRLSEEIISVTIGIPSFNEEKNIAKLLDALLVQETYKIRINKIVVVSSGSTDGTDKIVEKYSLIDKRIVLIKESERKGKASAINQCLKITTDSVVVLESADTIPKPDAIEKLCLPFLHDEKIGMTGAAPVPINDKDTFLGFIIHSWWWFHRNIPRFGELIAYRNVLPAVSTTTAVDEAYIQAKMVQLGFKIVHVDDAVVYNKGADNLWDLIKQRRRIFNGHSRLMEEENIRITNMTKSSLYLLFFKFEMVQFKHFIWLVGGIFLEVGARILGFIDRRFYSYNPFVWEVASTTKNLENKIPGDIE